MEMYLVKNEDGTQSVSTKKNDLDNIIGTWRLKHIKYDFIDKIVSEQKFKSNHPFRKINVETQMSLISTAIAFFIASKRQKIRQDKIYFSVLSYLSSMSKTNDYITIDSVLKHFKKIDKSIDKQEIINMVKKKLICKYYHRVRITKNGFKYLEDKKSPTN